MLMTQLGEGGNLNEGSRAHAHRGAVVQGLARVSDPSLLAEAAALRTKLMGSGWPWTEWTNQTMPFSATDIWRVNFSTPVPAAMAGRVEPTLVDILEIGSAGARLLRNNFTSTTSQLGRFKSPGGVVSGNRFSGAVNHNLEVSCLPQWFEGPVRLRGIHIESNVFDGVGADPIHCGPLCESHVTRAGVKRSCMDVSDTPMPCVACPNCTSPSPWAQVTVGNNTIVGSADVVLVAACSADDPRQQWEFEQGGTIRSKSDGLCLLGDGFHFGLCDTAPRWSLDTPAGQIDLTNGSWLRVVTAPRLSQCVNLQVYNYSGPAVSMSPCRRPSSEGARGTQNEEWAYTPQGTFRSSVSAACCGSAQRPIPTDGLCMGRGPPH
jgi:hypothetical protein